MSHEIQSKTLSYVPRFLRRLFVSESPAVLRVGYPPATLIQQAAKAYLATLSPIAQLNFNGRLERGLELALNGSVSPDSTSNKPNRFKVKSASGSGKYTVDLDARTCDCPDSIKGHCCKHRIAAYYVSQAMKQMKAQSPQSLASQTPSVPTNEVNSKSDKPLSREDQILKELGYEPDRKMREEAPQPVYRLGSLYSRYLHGGDLGQQAYQVTIQDLTKETVVPHPSLPQEEKWCLRVSGLPVGLPCRILFGVFGEKDLVAIFGRVDIQSLIGKRIDVYPATTTVAGQAKVSIRFRRVQ